MILEASGVSSWGNENHEWVGGRRTVKGGRGEIFLRDGSHNVRKTLYIIYEFFFSFAFCSKNWCASARRFQFLDERNRVFVRVLALFRSILPQIYRDIVDKTILSLVLINLDHGAPVTVCPTLTTWRVITALHAWHRRPVKHVRGLELWRVEGCVISIAIAFRGTRETKRVYINIGR